MTTKSALHWGQTLIGCLFIIVGGVQANAQLFGAQWSGLVLTVAGVVMALLIYLRTTVGEAPPA